MKAYYITTGRSIPLQVRALSFHDPDQNDRKNWIMLTSGMANKQTAILFR